MNTRPGKTDDTLKQLLIGILIFGAVSQLGGMFFVNSMSAYTIGLWIGIVLACGCAYHMWWSLNRNLTINADNDGAARAFAIKHNLIRYFFILIVFAGVCVTDFAYPLAAFLGIMGLKAGAYMQPLVKRLIYKDRS
ncbi:MAG: hypothetical protein K5877_10900 [Lachnospiraceae bacterium]|nr:hypothetical protein [Lachnospiraceae bacterium]